MHPTLPSPLPVDRDARGQALLLALVFLALLSLLAGDSIQRGLLSLRLAGNLQFREEALQQAESLVAALARDPANFPPASEVGDTLCPPAEACDGMLRALPDHITRAPDGVAVHYRVVRREPLLLGRLPRRLTQSEVSGNRAFRAAVFEARARVDGSAARLGTAEVAQGLALLVAAPAARATAE